MRLRQESSPQRIRNALNTLRTDLGEVEHLSRYQLAADGSTIYLVEPDRATDLVKRRGNLVIHQMVDAEDFADYVDSYLPARDAA